ncbi:MAG TPA: hypothetical protein VFT74_20030, partial [Isosphaeraceae bacterium]|nr:hypothetical protein [Isosphaeraceae bacterium]
CAPREPALSMSIREGDRSPLAAGTGVEPPARASTGTVADLETDLNGLVSFPDASLGLEAEAPEGASWPRTGALIRAAPTASGWNFEVCPFTGPMSSESFGTIPAEANSVPTIAITAGVSTPRASDETPAWASRLSGLG